MSGQTQMVTILLGTCNGAAYLPAQLASIAGQSHENWQILASDDASADATPEILDGFAQQHPLTRLTGPGQGLVRNYMHLLQALPADPGYVALCDQDDVWLPDKLRVALAWLGEVPAERPALYCGRRLVWDPRRGTRRLSYAYRRPACFANACIENIAPGNTILLNPAAAALARDLAATAADVFTHDWWLYLLITGVGGQVLYDPDPQLLYRQHDNNVIGAGERFTQALGNKLAVLKGAFAERLGLNIAAMRAATPYLTSENQSCLALFEEARKASLLRRLTLLRQAGVYRQGWLSGLTFWGAACLGKI